MAKWQDHLSKSFALIQTWPSFLITAKVCESGEDAEVNPSGQVPSGFAVTGPDGTTPLTGDIDTPDSTTTINFDNTDPVNTDVVPMEVTIPSVTPKDPTVTDYTVTVTLYPEDGSSPLLVPDASVRFIKYLQTFPTFLHELFLSK